MIVTLPFALFWLLDFVEEGALSGLLSTGEGTMKSVIFLLEEEFANLEVAAREQERVLRLLGKMFMY